MYKPTPPHQYCLPVLDDVSKVEFIRFFWTIEKFQKWNRHIIAKFQKWNFNISRKKWESARKKTKYPNFDRLMYGSARNCNRNRIGFVADACQPLAIKNGAALDRIFSWITWKVDVSTKFQKWNRHILAKFQKWNFQIGAGCSRVPKMDLICVRWSREIRKDLEIGGR